MAVSANRLELLQIADAVAREKAIDRGIVIAAMEDAIAKAARSRYGAETDVHAEIEPKTGDLRLTRHMLVVEAVENPSNQITLEEARKRHPAAQVGDTIADPLPPLEYGRIAAQSAKQVIVQKVREAERDRQYAEYKDRIGDIVNGIVKRVEYGNVVVDLGGTADARVVSTTPRRAELVIDGAALPDSLQRTTPYAAAVVATSAHPAEARAFVAFISDPANHPVIRATGLEPVFP